MTGGLELSEVTLRFGRVTAVDRLSLRVAPGETLGLIGESGCGKSSVARAIVGLARPQSGKILLDGAELVGISAPAGRVQMLFQDPVASLSPRMRLDRLIEEPLLIAGRTTPEARAAVRTLAQRVGLRPDILSRYPHQVSGGQARRVALVRALASLPRILIADEPTAGLDLSVQGDLLNLLAELRAEQGLGYLFISHNLNVIGRVTDRLAVMYLGEIVESGPTEDLFHAPEHPYTRALLSANLTVARRHLPRLPPLQGDVPSPADPPPGCRFHQRCPIAVGRCRSDRPTLQTRPGNRTVACHFPLTRSGQSGSLDHLAGAIS
jgi:peptide/nickel transport system ATP-binding protein